jgi:hypothetical protein
MSDTPPDVNISRADGYTIIDVPGTGATYIGHVQDQKPHGFGYMSFHRDNSQHQGEFRLGVADGPGVFLSANGTSHEGVWRANKRVGVFTVTRADGSVWLEKYKENGEMAARKRKTVKGEGVEEDQAAPVVGPVAKKCWICGGLFRDEFNSPYSCRKHRGVWRARTAASKELEGDGLWSCCVKTSETAPGCDFVEHNLSH